MNQPWSVPREWDGETVFILGGGPSGKGFDAERLRGKGRIIAIKEAGLTLCPWADVLYWTDGWWHDGRKSPYFEGVRDRLHLHTGAYKITRAAPVKASEHDIKVIGCSETGPLSRDPTRVAGRCSGGCAINLAYLFGAARILLLFFDMRGENWDGRVRSKRVPTIRAKHHMPAIAKMAHPLKEAGVEVLNATPGSALGCFPIVRLEDVLEETDAETQPVFDTEQPTVARLEMVPFCRLQSEIAGLSVEPQVRVHIRTAGADLATRRSAEWWQRQLMRAFPVVTVAEAGNSTVTFQCRKLQV